MAQPVRNERRSRACPWCLRPVAHVTSSQYRELVRGKRNLVAIATISEHVPCWYCFECGAGGLFV